MRLKNRQLPHEKAVEILKNASYGVLSMADETGAPYGVPINYYYEPQDNALYFHCALKGKKLDCIQANPRVSFTVVGAEALVPERFTTHYESVILSGTASLIQEPEEKRRYITRLCEVLTPGPAALRDAEIEKSLRALHILKLQIESITGKKNPPIPCKS